MNFLDKLGLGSKKNSKGPIIGEKKKQQEENASLRNNTYIRVLIILGFMAILFLSIPQSFFKGKISYSIGEPWMAEDLTAPFTFGIQKSEKEIAQEKEEIRQSITPIFYRQNNTHIRTEAKLDSLFAQIEQAFNAYQQQLEKADDNSAPQEPLAFIQEIANIGLSAKSWEALFQNYQATVINDQAIDSQTAPPSSYVGPQLKENISVIIASILQDGIINEAKNSLKGNEITLRNVQNSTEHRVNLANVRDEKQVQQYAQYRLSQLYDEDITQAGVELLAQAITPNLVYNGQETQNQIEKALASISTTKGAVAKGQVIIRKGDLVTQEKLNMLKSLAEARSLNASNTERWLRYTGEVLVIISIVIIFFFYLYLYRRNIFMDNSMLLLVLITMSIICVASSLVYQFNDISLYIVPVAIAPLILTVIFDSRVGILASITLALLVGLIHGNSFEFVTATMAGCCLGLFSVRDIKKRSQFFIITPGIVFISYAVVIIGFNMAVFEGWNNLTSHLIVVALNALFLFVTYPLILLFEKTFKVTTDLTLIELSDTNLPLLKELMNKAPGTFHHSLQVANLSEAAAGAIRANGLLCRVASLYHDIGKMEKPGYFAENQLSNNEHEKLKPRMSALVIKAHISNGVKIAKKHHLPELVINFIKTHHGTSVIKYFYNKAKEQANSDRNEIKEEDFQYSGPIPNSKETGIVMLADGIEAASRAMKNPNYQKLKSLIDKMVDDRVFEGQLSNTPLTFQDLSIIKETFLNILVGIYHSRVEYPEDEEDGRSSAAKGGEKKDVATKVADQTPSTETNQEERAPSTVNEYFNS